MNPNSIWLVVGARPNFMKAAPLHDALRRRGFEHLRIVHTGQHYDHLMSRAFFEDLNLPDPDCYLEAGSGSHAEQTAKIMVRFERELRRERPGLVVVFGDVNSTIACGLTAVKQGVPLAHVEAGLRSHDMGMPEEINRRLTDAISDLLFTPCAGAGENLKREGVPGERIFFVGNIMIDSLRRVVDALDDETTGGILRRYNVSPHTYGLVTLHRPSNVDEPDRLRDILKILNRFSAVIPLVFPLHPRTRDRIESLPGGFITAPGLAMPPPLRYREFIALEKNAAFVLTDSGGIQEETTYLKVPCLTLRPNTERPVTLLLGSNRLVSLAALEETLRSVAEASAPMRGAGAIPLWDGGAAERITDTLLERLG